MSPYIREFAEALIKHVRDEAIIGCDYNLIPNKKGVEAERWRQMLAGDPVELAKALIPDCIDAALGELLLAIDHEKIRLFFQSEDGSLVDLAEEGRGEMTGEYLGGELREDFSKQRFIDNTEGSKGYFSQSIRPSGD